MKFLFTNTVIILRYWLFIFQIICYYFEMLQNYFYILSILCFLVVRYLLFFRYYGMIFKISHYFETKCHYINKLNYSHTLTDHSEICQHLSTHKKLSIIRNKIDHHHQSDTILLSDPLSGFQCDIVHISQCLPLY